jgi:hypothetical protein
MGIPIAFLSLSSIWNSRLKVSTAISEAMFELFDIRGAKRGFSPESGGRYWTGHSTSNIPWGPDPNSPTKRQEEVSGKDDPFRLSYFLLF